MKTYKDLQYKIFGYYDAHVILGSWKETILSTAQDLEEMHLLTDKMTGMIKENKLYAMHGIREHPDSIFRMRSLHI